jgi:hypothetical protein
MSPSPTHILSTSPSGLSMSHPTISDIPQLSTLWARSFHPNNPFYQALVADSPSTRAWWASAHEKAIADKEGTIFLKCTDGEKIVALDRWVRPAKVDGGVPSDGYGGDGEGGVERWPQFGEGFDMELSGAFFGAMAEHMEMLMGGGGITVSKR